jgi:hypothetical protein
MRLFHPSRVILAGLLFHVGFAAEPFPGPWRETFPMQVEGETRTVAVNDTGMWLVITRADLMAGRFLGGSTEVVMASKLERSVFGLRLIGLPEIRLSGDPAAWREVADGDNAWLFGRLTRAGDGGPLFTVLATAHAPSDRQRIQQRQEGIRAEDWNARLAVAAWIRDQAVSEPNKEFWLSAADEAVIKVVEDAVASAQKGRDLALVNQVLDWCLDLVRDPGLAGRVVSVPWLVAESDPSLADLHRRLRRLGLELYKDRWMPRSEALAHTFDDRFEAIPWNDAEAFFRLGRWVDVNAEALTMAKDRAYRAYRAGQRADPKHEGIRNALGADGKVATAENASHKPTPEDVPQDVAPVSGDAPTESDTKPNELELGREGWQQAQRSGVVSLWMRPPRADEAGQPAQVELLFWNDGTDQVLANWSVEYAGETRNAAVRLESRRRFTTSVSVMFEPNSVPMASLILAQP